MKNVEAIRQAIKLHPSVVEVVELLAMRRAPKQILVNAHVNLRNDLTNEQIIESIAGIEENMKKVKPKVDMIFLETASLKNSESKEINLKHIG